MKLRPYQQKAISDLYQWFYAHQSPDEHPCLVLPTGAGKSIIIAELVKNVLHNWPETRVLMLTHQKELIEQNAEKLQHLWPTAPLGVFSASLNRKVLHRSITYAGIQSIHRHAQNLGHIDLCIIDECHLINHSESGTYRKFLAELKQINPRMRIVGLTATEYRLGHGLITDGDDRLFTDLIKPVSIDELIAMGFLARLESKPTNFKIDVSKVKKIGGEYVEKYLQEATDTDEIVSAIICEVLPLAYDLRSILWFCTGVENANHYADELTRIGETAHAITGKTPKKLRAELLAAFKAGEIRHLTNANVLTTGFDAPNIDGIVMARPTLSPSLYVQMAGRGLRLKQHTDHCKVFDFAGNIRQHGPITCVVPPKKKGGGPAPTKECPRCREILHASAKECTSCGHLFISDGDGEIKERIVQLYDDDIMGGEEFEMSVKNVIWSLHKSRKTGEMMIKAKYVNADLLGDNVDEYFPLLSASEWARKIASKKLNCFFAKQSYYALIGKADAEEKGSDVDFFVKDEKDLEIIVNGNGDGGRWHLEDIVLELSKMDRMPVKIKAKRKGKFFDVTERIFND